MRVLENASDLETAHKAAEESGVPPTAPEALIALKAADVLAVAFDRHLQQAEEEKRRETPSWTTCARARRRARTRTRRRRSQGGSAVEVDLDVRFPRLVFSFARDVRHAPRTSSPRSRRRRVDALDTRRRCRRRRRRRRASEK